MGHLDGLYTRHVLNAKHALGCTDAAGSNSRSNALTRRGLWNNTAFGGRRLQTYGALVGRRLQTFAAFGGRRLQTYATDDNEEHAAQNACPGRRHNYIG